jgi:imidazolonepropionase-like amidohydrolase
MLKKIIARFALASILIHSFCAAAPAHAATSAAPADSVYRNGKVYTVDARDSLQQALAIRAGRIVYVGSDAGLEPLIGAHTTIVDLHGRMLMPGLIDGHMHPMQGGAGRTGRHRGAAPQIPASRYSRGNRA